MASQNFEPIHFPSFKDKSDSKTPLLGSLFVFFVFFVFFLFIYFLYLCARRRPDDSAAAAAAAPPPGLDPATISSLPVSAYAKPPSRAAECAICLSLFQEGEKVKSLPLCRHRFHSDCVDEWLATRPSCPLCRGGVRRVDSLSRDVEAGRWVCASAE